MTTPPNRAAIVTGASSGLGHATARALAAAGYAVGAVARDTVALDGLIRTIEDAGGRGVALAADLADPDAPGAAVETAVAELGRLDAVVHAAATDAPGALDELDVDGWDRTLDVNLRAAFLLAKHAFPYLREAGGGTIVTVSSVAGRRGWPGAAAYCASKFGLTGLTQVINAEGRDHAIRAALVQPGAMDTHWGAWDQAERAADDLAGSREPHRALPPEQVADLITWIVTAPPGLVLNESTVTPLFEQGWP